jgi:membrane protein DedA with SNARE-associated domain
MLAELVRLATEWVGAVVSSAGAGGILIVALLENLFPPTPSEFLYPLAGKLAYDGQLTIPVIILAGIAGTMIGATVWYYLGYRLGEERTRAFINRYGTLKIGRWHLHLFDVQEYDNALDLFRRRGGIILIIGRIMPLVHGVVSIPAGVSRMPLVPFYLYTAVGTGIWVGILTVLGYVLGSQWENILSWLDVYQNIWYVAIVAIVGYLLLRRWQHRAHKITPEAVQPK